MLGPGHVDVVPVTPDDVSKSPQTYTGWDHDPWSGTVKDGVVFGRGTVSSFLWIVLLLAWCRLYLACIHVGDRAWIQDLNVPDL